MCCVLLSFTFNFNFNFNFIQLQIKMKIKIAKALPTMNSMSRSLRTSQFASGVQSPSMIAQVEITSAKNATVEPTEESNRALLKQLKDRLDHAFPDAVMAVMPSCALNGAPE